MLSLVTCFFFYQISSDLLRGLNFVFGVFQALTQLPREKVQLATKFGIVNFESTQVVVNGTPEYVRSCCEASLKRLGIGYIDLSYQHNSPHRGHCKC